MIGSKKICEVSIRTDVYSTNYDLLTVPEYASFSVLKSSKSGITWCVMCSIAPTKIHVDRTISNNIFMFLDFKGRQKSRWRRYMYLHYIPFL